jgi:hypothetical protein
LREPTKSVKHALRRLSAVAHEEELQRALLPVATAFEEWRAGQLSSGELTERIHDFHQGPARELFKRYHSGPPEYAVARAIVVGVLDRKAVPAEVLEHCKGAIELLEGTPWSD